MVRPWSLAACFLAGVAAWLASAGPAWAHGRDPHARVAAEKGWRTDLRAAREESHKSGKPVMVVLRCFD